jgi:hypothetical protein
MAISVSCEIKGTECVSSGRNKTSRNKRGKKTIKNLLDISGIKLAENLR